MVIDRGLYAIVRHPGYVGGVLFSLGIALAQGSLWALIPAGLASLVLILRTKWEDEMFGIRGSSSELVLLHHREWGRTDSGELNNVANNKRGPRIFRFFANGA